MKVRRFVETDWDEWFRMSLSLFHGETSEADKGYTEMGSDALIDNEVSHAAHQHSGYQIVDRVVTFRKDLYPVSK